MKKKTISFILTLALLFGLAANLSVPAYAAEGGYLTTITAGYTGQSSYCVKSDGTLWGWGSNIAANNTFMKDCPTPVKVMENIKSIKGTLAIKNDNSLWVQYPGLPQGLKEQLDEKHYSSGSSLDINYVHYDWYHFMDDVKAIAGSNAVIKQDNSLWIWGYSESLLGATPEKPQNYETPVKIMDGVESAYAAGGSFFIIKTDHSLWATGYNGTGQLGDGTTEEKTTFVKIMDGVKAVSTYYSGNAHTLILKEDGSLWACGNNFRGVIGDGTETQYEMFNPVPVIDNDRYTPVKIMDGVKSIHAGSDCSFAITEDNNLWGWGYKQNLGLGDVAGNQLVPMKLMDNVADINSLSQYLILKLDGSLWAYGSNNFGQIGDGTTTSRNTAIKVMDGVKLPTTATAASPAQPAAPALTAKPTSSTVLVDGWQVAFDAYNIGGNNYFKLRDLAFALNGSEKQFEVGWDGANNAISLTSGKEYTVLGSEMTGKGPGDKTPTPTSSKIYLDGKVVMFTAYNIEGNNYFKLRDIGEAFDFGVTWDGAKNTIVIDTSKGYTPD